MEKTLTLINSKRIIVLVALLAISTVAFAQQRTNNTLNNYIDSKHIKVDPEYKKAISAGFTKESLNQKMIYGNEDISKPAKGEQPLTGNGSGILSGNYDSLPGEAWITSYYEFQTNGAMPERVAYYTNGINDYLQMFWMCDIESSTWNYRGTYYDYATLTAKHNPAPQYVSSSRIEGNVRTGWPSMAQFEDGTVGTPSHDPTPGAGQIFYTRNGEAFDPIFTTTTLTPTRALWPRSVIDVNQTIHAIYTYDTVDAGKEGDVFYRKSYDGGETWTEEVRLSGPGSIDGDQTKGYGGDVYAIACRGTNIVVCWVDTANYFQYRKSTDAGITWSAPNVILHPFYETYYSYEDLGNGKIRYTTDTVFTPGNQIDCIIDSQGRAHFVCGIFGTAKLGTAKTDGTNIYDQVDSVTMGFIYYGIGLAYQYEGATQGATLFGNPRGTGYDALENDIRRVSRRWAFSNSECPQLGLDEEDNLYCVYSGYVPDDYTTVTVSTSGGGTEQIRGLNGHLYFTWKYNDPSYGWSEPKNFTPYQIDCNYPSLCNDVISDGATKWLYVSYSADDYPGDRVTDETLPISEAYIYIAAIDKDSLNPSTVISSVDEPAAATLDMQIFPNPVSGYAQLLVSMNTDGIRGSIEMFDMLGRKVQTVYNGYIDKQNNFSLDFNGIQNGVYYLVLNTKAGKSSCVVSIAH
jgi:hypothetical protein